jgi:hypothetical protein
VVPSGMVGSDGLMAIETRTATVTVRTVEPVIPPEVALMVAVPGRRLLARPVLLTVAVEGVSEAQVALEVRSCVSESVNVPVALNCWVVPNAIDGVAGVTAIDTSTAVVTARVVLPLIEPDVAVIVVVPTPALVAKPLLPGVLLIVATVADDELHCTVVVISWVLPSVKVPVAVNCCAVPRGTLGVAGVTAIETRAAGVTFTLVEPVMNKRRAVTRLLPTATLVTNPWPFTVATVGRCVVQVTEVVRSCVLPSSKVPVAVICSVVPNAKEGLVGVTAIETKICADSNVAEAIQNRTTATTFRQFLAGRAIELPKGPHSFMIYLNKSAIIVTDKGKT